MYNTSMSLNHLPQSMFRSGTLIPELKDCSDYYNEQYISRHKSSRTVLRAGHGLSGDDSTRSRSSEIVR